LVQEEQSEFVRHEQSAEVVAAYEEYLLGPQVFEEVDHSHTVV